MKQEDLEYFRTLLTDRLNELLKHADSTVTGMTQPKENFADPTDRASHEAERSFELRIRDREHKLIKKSKNPGSDRKRTFGRCEPARKRSPLSGESKAGHHQCMNANRKKTWKTLWDFDRKTID